jgi:peptidoglycan/LPS O-acetylase OafA/YrhL
MWSKDEQRWHLGEFAGYAQPGRGTIVTDISAGSKSRDSNGRGGATQSRIPELDGLRGIAILLILCAHFLDIPGAPLASTLSRFQRLFSMNWVGVDLFFVLSGFLIGGILLDVRKSTSYFRTFYIRRFFRIVPLYYIWILGYILLVTIAGRQLSNHGATTPQAHLSLAAQLLFVQNLAFAQNVGLAFAWFAATWSLAVEEQFYLVSPFLVRFLSTRALSMVLGLTILAAPCVRILMRSHLPHGYFAAYALTPCRADDLAFGILVAIAWRNRSVHQWLSSHVSTIRTFLGFLFIGAIGWWRWEPDPFGVGMQWVGYTWIGLFFTTLLLAVLLRPASWLGWVTRMWWLRELGEVSYCAYIIHMTVNLFCHILITGNAPQISDWGGVFATLCALVLTYAIAKLSWIILENPLRQYGHKFRYSEPPKVVQGTTGVAEALDSQSVTI